MDRREKQGGFDGIKLTELIEKNTKTLNAHAFYEFSEDPNLKEIIKIFQKTNQILMLCIGNEIARIY